ncbi:MAG: type II secretion system protein [Victivallales bacterium]|nr:type II secretion system protein [Victivallales bacterium]
MPKMHRIEKKRAFTLVEIMVTMAILVVMMSFLFQYVIGAQKIFTASNRQAVLFDDAQIVLGLMENDLQNMVVSNEPGREIPMFYNKGSYTDADGNNKTYHILMIVTSGESTKLNNSEEVTLVGYYLVVYCYCEEDEKLYRVAIDNKTALDETNLKPWNFFGLDFVGNTTATERNALITKYASGMVTKMTSDYELMDAVSAFRIIPLNSDDFDSSTHFAKVRPNAIKIELTLYDAEKVSKDLPDERQEELKKENSRLFSKVIFFNDMR